MSALLTFWTSAGGAVATDLDGKLMRIDLGLNRGLSRTRIGRSRMVSGNEEYREKLVPVAKASCIAYQPIPFC